MSGGDASGEMAAMVAYMATFDDPAEAKAAAVALADLFFGGETWDLRDEAGDIAIQRLLSLASLQLEVCVDDVLIESHEAHYGREASNLATRAPLLFELDLVQYDDAGNLVDGARFVKAREALHTKASLGALNIENIVIAALNWVLSDDDLKKLIPELVYPHCFYGGYSMCAALFLDKVIDSWWNAGAGRALAVGRDEFKAICKRVDLLFPNELRGLKMFKKQKKLLARERGAQADLFAQIKASPREGWMLFALVKNVVMVHGGSPVGDMGILSVELDEQNPLSRHGIWKRDNVDALTAPFASLVLGIANAVRARRLEAPLVQALNGIGETSQLKRYICKAFEDKLVLFGGAQAELFALSNAGRVLRSWRPGPLGVMPGLDQLAARHHGLDEGAARDRAYAGESAGDYGDALVASYLLARGFRKANQLPCVTEFAASALALRETDPELVAAREAKAQRTRRADEAKAQRDEAREAKAQRTRRADEAKAQRDEAKAQPDAAKAQRDPVKAQWTRREDDLLATEIGVANGGRLRGYLVLLYDGGDPLSFGDPRFRALWTDRASLGSLLREQGADVVATSSRGAPSIVDEALGKSNASGLVHGRALMIVSNGWTRPYDSAHLSAGRLRQFATADRAFTEDWVARIVAEEFDDPFFEGYEDYLITELHRELKATGAPPRGDLDSAALFTEGWIRRFRLHGPGGQRFRVQLPNERQLNAEARSFVPASHAAWTYGAGAPPPPPVPLPVWMPPPPPVPLPVWIPLYDNEGRPYWHEPASGKSVWAMAPHRL